MVALNEGGEGAEESDLDLGDGVVGETDGGLEDEWDGGYGYVEEGLDEADL